jgi:Ca-activated chloride channel family protein
MLNLFNRLKNNKPLLFGLYGASGCLTAAILLGEPFLALTKLAKTSSVTSQAIVLLIDTSSSMSYGKLTEVKTAASKFMERRHLLLLKFLKKEKTLLCNLIKNMQL